MSAPTALARAAPAREQMLSRRIRLLVATTISYNVVEAAVALTAGAAASSTALVGFGLDSLIEVSSAAAVAWQFSAPTARSRQDRERAALRVIAVSFLALAGYVTIQPARALAAGGHPLTSRGGLVLAAVSVVVMPVLSSAQRRTGRELGSASAVADSNQTLLCTYLSAVLLVGLALNALFGWGWADPAAGLVIAALALVESRRAWHGDSCCTPAAGSRAKADTAGATEPSSCCGDGAACCAAPAVAGAAARTGADERAAR